MVARRPVTIAERLDAALPQTQCTRCGYADCRAYASAIAVGSAAINRCPPGGAEGVARLAAIVGTVPVPLDESCGVEAPRARALIDEAWCIGCTLCLAVCPVDCIIGTSKRMHTVVAEQCTGCELCLPACPVDCIVLVPASDQRTGWAAWSPSQAAVAQERYARRQTRQAPVGASDEPPPGTLWALTEDDATATPSGDGAPSPAALLAAALARARGKP